MQKIQNNQSTLWKMQTFSTNFGIAWLKLAMISKYHCEIIFSFGLGISNYTYWTLRQWEQDEKHLHFIVTNIV